MGPDMFDGFDTAIKAGLWTLAISVPLGLWKLVEIVIWLIGVHP